MRHTHRKFKTHTLSQTHLLCKGSLIHTHTLQIQRASKIQTNTSDISNGPYGFNPQSNLSAQSSMLNITQTAVQESHNSNNRVRRLALRSFPFHLAVIFASFLFSRMIKQSKMSDIGYINTQSALVFHLASSWASSRGSLFFPPSPRSKIHRTDPTSTSCQRSCIVYVYMVNVRPEFFQ